MTHEERAERIEALRRYHDDLTPHYDDCGCAECNAHLLILELDWVREDSYRSGYRDAQRSLDDAEVEIEGLRAPRCPTCGAEIEASDVPNEEMLDAATGAIFSFAHCVNGHEATVELTRLPGSADVVPSVFRRFQVLAMADDVVGEALALLRAIEWSGVYRYTERACLFCARPERGNVLVDEGHAEGCRLKAFLTDAR